MSGLADIIASIQSQLNQWQEPVEPVYDQTPGYQNNQQAMKQAVDESTAYANYAALGVNPYDDRLYQQNVDAIQAAQPATIKVENEDDSLESRQGKLNEWVESQENNADFNRRFIDPDTGYVKNPLDWNVFGFTSQQKTPKAALDLYDYYYAQRDANPMQEGTPEWEENRGTWGRSIKEGEKSAAAPTVVNMNFGQSGYDYFNDPLYQNLQESAQEVPKQSVVGEDAIDNGISEKARESLYMTGKEYKRLRELGIPGRDINDIQDDANTIYSKQDEQDNYGFIPYLVSDEGLNKFHDDASMNAVNNVFNNLSDLRRNNTSYTYEYDGHTYDGKDFIKNYNKWAKSLDTNPVPFEDPSKVTEDSVPLTWVMKDSVTGEDVYAPNANGELTTDPETGQPMIDFHTDDPGDNWYFDNDEDLMNSFGYDYAGNDHPVLGWENQKPLVLSDGQKIRADKAMELYGNKDKYANYGNLDWGKPSVENPLEEGGLAPWFVDMALGSAPLFWGPTAGSQAFANAYNNMQGVKAGTSQVDDGTYKLVSEDPTRGEQLMTSTGSAILPATERLWGVASEYAMPFAKALAKKHPQIAEHPISKIVENATGEAIEEVPGNLVEEMQSAGTINDYFANKLYYYIDKDGNKVYTTSETNPENPNEKTYPAYDAQNKRLTDKYTNPIDRAGNFFEEAPVSMLGGATLGGAISAVPSALSYGEYKQKYDDLRKEREKFGHNAQVPETVTRYLQQHYQEGE